MLTAVGQLSRHSVPFESTVPFDPGSAAFSMACLHMVPVMLPAAKKAFADASC